MESSKTPAPVLPAAEVLTSGAARLDELLGARSEPGRFFLRDAALRLGDSSGFGTLVRCARAEKIFFYPHQVEAVCTLIEEFHGRGLLADEVGLGKTVEAGLIVKEYIHRGLAKRILVLTPASLVLQWREEMTTKFGLQFQTHLDKERWSDAEMLIISIDSAKSKRFAKAFQGRQYDVVIVDEAHKLKNHRSLNWKFVQSLSTKFLLMLTATPIQNSLEELYNLIFLLKPGYLQTRKLFRKQFTVTSNSKIPKNPEKLKDLLKKVVIRHRRVETSIPFTQRNVHLIPVDFSKQELATYQYLNQFIASSYGGLSHFERGINRLTLILLERMVTSSPQALISTLARILVNPALPPGFAEQLAQLSKMAQKIKAVSKARRVLDIVRGLDEKVIIFTQFRETQEYVARLLDEYKVDNILFYGGLTPRRKDEIIREFAGPVRVLISTDSGAEGRNLQFCRHLVNFDLPWNPMKVEQRIGRVHRLGQQKDVDIYNIFYRDSIEEYVVELLMHKIRLFKLVVGELDIILGLTKQAVDLEDKIMDIVVQSKTKRELKYNFDKLGRQFSRALHDYERVKKAQDTLY